jgi:hypothetical protein
MFEPAMHEHISKQLMQLKLRRQEKVESQQVGQVDAHPLQRESSEKQQCIDDDEVFGNRG